MAAPDPATFEKKIKPLLVEYCWDCHGDGASKGDVTLDKHANVAEMLKDRKLWQAVLVNLQSQAMPPAKKAPPKPAERDLIVEHHLGGVIPYLEGRVGHSFDQLGARTSDEDYVSLRKSLKKRPLDYFKQDFWADTATFGGKGAMLCGLDFYPEDKILFASDCPFDPEKGPNTHIVVRARDAEQRQQVVIGPAETVAAEDDERDAGADQVGGAGGVDQVDALAEMIDVQDGGVDRVLVLLLRMPMLILLRHLLSRPLFQVRPAGDELPYKFETGTQNHEGIAGVLGALE